MRRTVKRKHVENVAREGGVGARGIRRKAKGDATSLVGARSLRGRNVASADAPAEKKMDDIISNLPDFKNEKSALQHTVEGRGHIPLLSPKFHPEVAGVGIEYSWGMSKLKFRREINDEVPKHLHENIVTSMCRETILTLGRVRRFARRCRDYCRAYFEHGAIESKQKIEQMRKVAKAHRNIIDMEPGFIDKQ